MEVNKFQILLINVTFYLYQAQKLICNVPIKNIKKEHGRHRQLKS